ncbi:MAG: glycosyl hydrolase family 17 protein [Chloroflexota bacterium]
MPGRFDTINTLLSLLFILVLAGCASPSAATPPVPVLADASPLPRIESSPTFTPAPTASVTPAVTPSPTPTKAISQWLLSGSYVQAGTGASCAAGLAPGAVLLGADSSTCQPAEMEGVAEILAQSPPGADQIALLRLTCADTEGGCTNAVTVAEPGGVISLSVDDQLLWRADCLTLTPEECTTRFVAEEPIFAFAAGETAVHHIQIKTSPHISWLLSDIQIEWQSVPEAIRGVAFSPFRDCQNPHWGPFPSLEQVQEDLLLMRHMGNAVRTYSSMDVQGQIPALAHDLGLRVVAGAWLGPDKEKNEAEIAALIELVRQDVGIESVIVGNEVLLRGDLTEAELIAYIERVKTAVDVPVTTAETIGHLYNRPELIAAVDYVMVHIYAFWDGVAIENAAQHTLHMYHLTQDIAQGKPVVIGETGWPAKGPTNGTAVASVVNEQRFWHEFLTLAQQENIEFFTFAAFDELWKTEGGVGPYWGIFDSERRNKFDLQSVYVPLNHASQPAAEVMPMPTATRGATLISAQEELFPIFVNYAAAENHFAPSGHMGDYHAIAYTDCARLTDVWEETAVLISYDPALQNEQGWAAIYWQEPENNWGYYPEGYNLQNFAHLRFQAFSPQAGSQVQFFVGGVYTGTYPSSIPNPIFAREADAEGFVTLSSEWQEFHIDLQNADLSHVIDGFGWLASEEKTPDGVTVYVDNIVFSQQRLPTAAPQPTATPSPPTPIPAPQSHSIYAGSTLSPSYDMGIDTGPGRLTDWVADQGGHMCLHYPGGQDWGAVFITNGPPQPPGSRPGKDLSAYSRLYVELRSETGDQSVQIGVKDNADPDDGGETKFTIVPPGEWQGYAFPLSDFRTADPANLYVMLEFVFGSAPANVCFRNVLYLP